MNEPFVTYDPRSDSWDVIYRGRMYPFMTEKSACREAASPETLPIFASFPVEATNDDSD